MPKSGVSVVMPIYNGERFVAETIESVLNQSLREIELIAVDDGSTDSSPDILAGYARRDSRVVVLRQNQAGVPTAANTGTRRAKYDLVARIDADDRMLPDRLERQLSFFERRPHLAVACSNCYFIDVSGKRIGQSSCSIDVEKGRRERRPSLFLELTHSTVMMRKKLFFEVGGYREDLFYGDDRHLWGLMATNGFSIECQNEFLTEYRLHGGALTMGMAEMQRELCTWIDLNIVRRLEGQPELSLGEFRLWEERQPFVRRMRERLNFKALHSFKKASRFYGERRYLKCAFSLAVAVSLNPTHIVDRAFSRIQNRDADFLLKRDATV
jgi:glycosyltransferase involved in cell wall biosynthesis